MNRQQKIRMKILATFSALLLAAGVAMWIFADQLVAYFGG